MFRAPILEGMIVNNYVITSASCTEHQVLAMFRAPILESMIVYNYVTGLGRA